MNGHRRDDESDLRQYVRYLLHAPILFAVGFGLAKLLAIFAGEGIQKWLDPVNWGGVAALFYIVQHRPSSSPTYAPFGPRPPNSRNLALVMAIAFGVYATALFELLLFRNRALLAEPFGDWFVTLMGVLVPVVAVVGGWRMYQNYLRKAEGRSQIDSSGTSET